jgi:hypothetical protein
VPAKLLCSFCVVFVSFIFTAKLFAQDPATKKIVAEATRLRETNSSPDTNLQKAAQDKRDRIAALNDALRDWVESRLPKSKPALDAGFDGLQDRLKVELSRAGVLPPANGADEYGYIARLELSRPSEFSGALAIIEGITAPCGTADSVYVYDYNAGSPRRILESRGSSEHDETVSSEYFSSPDVSGNRLFLVFRHAVQCGSSWNRLSYDLFRLSTSGSAAAPIFSGDHGIWKGANDAYHIQLKPDEMLLELQDRSVDAHIRNRTHVLRYSIGPSAVERIDPVALQPQDFVDEWLTRPWAEMALRSSATVRDNLEKWHSFLGGDSDTGEIRVVQPCTDKQDDWKIVLTMEWVAGKKLPESFTVNFRVRALGKYRFEMTAVSFHPDDGCPGDAPPITGSLSLFETNPQKKETQSKELQN